MRFKILEMTRAEEIAYGCTQCGYCDADCPTGNALRWELASPRGKIWFTRWLRDHGHAIPREFVDRMFQCTMCGRCSTECEADLDTITLWKHIRAEIGRAGLWPEGISRLVSAVRRTRNVFGIPNEERLMWAAESQLKDRIAQRVNRPANVCYFVGCMSSFHGRLASIPDAMVKILEAAKVNYTILGGEEWCSGTPLHFVGEYDTSRQLAEHNAWKMERLGVDTVVTPCAGCYRAFKLEYQPLFGPMSFRVLHSSEFILQLIAEGKLKPSEALNRKVAYHDPCLLGRHCGVYEPPRQLLQKLPGVSLLELPGCRAKARCSGGGGDMLAVFPELAYEIGKDLIGDAQAIGAEVVATGCPTAKLTLMGSLERFGHTVSVMDLVEVAARAVSLAPQPPPKPAPAAPSPPAGGERRA